MKKVQLKVDGMTCSACSSGLEKYLVKQKGILSASVNLILGMVTIECDDLSISELQNYIVQAGFSSPGEYSYTDDSKVYKLEKRNLFIFGILLILLMYVSMGHMLSLPMIFSHTEYPVLYGLILLFISSLFLIYGFDILKSGFLNLLHCMPNMDTLVLFSVFFSFFYSIYSFIQICFGNTLFLHELYFESVAMVIYFVKLGRFIENISKNKTTSAIQNLVTITPMKAVMKKGDDFVSVTLDEIKLDDILVCRANEKFAVDGEVGDGIYRLKNHGAKNQVCYDYLKDIQRIETVKKGIPDNCEKGYTVFLTNYLSYRKPAGKNCGYSAFSLEQGKNKTGIMEWGEKMSDGTTKGRTKAIQLNSNYPIQWNLYSKVDETAAGSFYILYNEIK